MQEYFDDIIELEEDVLSTMEECPGNECIEYENGTFNCENCRFYTKHRDLQTKADEYWEQQNQQEW